MSIRSTLILVAILILLGGFIFISDALKPEVARVEAPEVWTVEEESIKGIVVSLPSKGKSESFVIGSDEYWDFNDADKSPVDLKRWGGIVLLVTGPASRRKIAENVDNPEDFGMTNPRLTVDLTISGREKPLLIQVGDPTPDEEHYYIMVKGGDIVYTIHRSWPEVFTRLVNEPPHPPVKRVKVPPKKD